MDIVFLKIIQLFAHVPEIDTCVAKKIKGPGISKKIFTSIDLEDIQVILFYFKKRF